MDLVCLGINHRTAPLEVRETLWFSAGENREALPALKERFAAELVLTSTCNRTELYYVPRPGREPGEPVWEALAALKGGASRAREGHFYTIPSLHAAKHLFSVATGIDSMVLGDVQILNQIKEGYAIARESGSAGALLNRLFSHALHVGKRARTETDIGEGAVSLGYAAAELTSKIYSDLTKRAALLIGAGETGKLTAQHLASRSLGSFVFANRTRQRAEALASRLHGTVVEFGEISSQLDGVDVIISAVESPGYILTADHLRHALKQRGNKPLVVIDLGVPRNIAPEAGTIENIFLHDLDTLQHVIDRNLAHRQAEVGKVEAIVLEELTLFHNWFASLDVTPTIQELSRQFEAIRSAEVAKHRHHFSGEKEEELEILTKRIVNKILHTPITNLRNGVHREEGGAIGEKISLLRHLFGLDKNGTS
jgi:glutamyl-tRNA reductase